MKKAFGILKITALAAGIFLLYLIVRVAFFDSPSASLQCWFDTDDKTETIKFLEWGIAVAIAAYGLGVFGERGSAQMEINRLQIFAFIMGLSLLLISVEIMFFDSSSARLQCWLGDTNDRTEAFKLLGLGIGGAIAAYGLGALDKRASAQVEINKLTEEGLFQERFRAAIDHLSDSKEESGRIASFYEFIHLAKSSKETKSRGYYIHNILDILCTHLRLITDCKDDFASEKDAAKAQDSEQKEHSQETKTLIGLLCRKETSDIFEGLSFNLKGVNLSSMDFRGMYIPKGYIDLRYANLRNADLSGAALEDANLGWADLRGADLPSANLSAADLQDAKLQEADLRKANLWGAGLLEAKLQGTKLQEADLSFADLSTAQGLEDANLTGAIYSPETQFPSGFDPSAAGLVLKNGDEE